MLIVYATVLMLILVVLLYTKAYRTENNISNQEQDKMDCKVISIVNKQNPGITGYYLDCRASIELRWVYNEQ